MSYLRTLRCYGGDPDDKDPEIAPRAAARLLGIPIKGELLHRWEMVLFTPDFGIVLGCHLE
jgi:hypothetical protein